MAQICIGADTAKEPKTRPSKGYLAFKEAMQGIGEFDPNKGD